MYIVNTAPGTNGLYVSFIWIESYLLQTMTENI